MTNFEKIEKHIIPLDHSAESIRIGEYLTGKFSALPSRKSIKQSLKSGKILLNGMSASTASFVKNGDVIELLSTFSPPGKIYQMEMEVIHEDDYLAIINKPGGIPVSGNSFRTVYNALGCFLKIDHNQCFYPQPTHRLDSATSGLLIIAKTLETRISLGKLFEDKLIKKEYQAIVHGHVAFGGLINFPIDGKSDLKFSHLRLQPTTGRTHQLRKHCLAMGHPILGDKLYPHQGWQLRKKGLLLCATGLQFEHPITNDNISLSIDPPSKFTKLMQK